MSWVRVYTHAVFTTKNRFPFFNSFELRLQILEHIKSNATSKEIKIDTVGGYSEHIHCLIALSKDLTIKDTMRMIKGESSHWINKSKLLTQNFNWQDDYWMVGVSESHIAQVRSYINNQELHHKKKSFNEEIGLFLEKYGWDEVKEIK